MRIKPFFNVSKIKIIFLISVGIFLISNFVLASPYPLFGQNPQHTGQSQFSGPETNEIKWTYENVVSRSHIIDSDGTVYLESNQSSLQNHQFQAINPDSSLKWSIQLGSFMNPLLTPMIGLNGMIYLAQTNGNLYAIDSNNGQIEWNISLSGKLTEPVLSENGIIYIANEFALISPLPYRIYGGNLYAIDSNNGDILWTFTQNFGGFKKSPVIGHNGIIYLPSSQTYNKSYLFAINPLNGLEIWQKQISGFPYTTSPVIDKNGTIYIGGLITFYFLNPDGEIKWRNPVGPNGWSAHLFMPSIDNEREMVYLPTSCCGLQAYDFDGNLKWTFQGEDNDYFRSQPTIDADGTIYLVGKHLYAINPDGSLKWVDQENLYSNSINYIPTPTIGIDNSLYVNSHGKLVKFGSAVSEQKQKELIEDYFPYWKFSQGEKYYPTSFYFDNNADVEDNRENYEKQTGNWMNPYVYAHTVEDNSYFTIQYWIYMAFNEHPVWFDHEHDFDATIFVVFNKNNLDQPIEVRFARHWSMGICPWSRVVKKDTTHPVVYVAEGSHGGYYSEDMGYFDIFNPGGLTYGPNFFNYYQVGNCVEETIEEINGEQREFCKVENELIKGEVQNEPADRYWPNKFGDPAPWKSEDATLPWFKDRWNQTRPTGITNQIEFEVACPVDLHIYDQNGRHIGINYDTGKPEIEILYAIFKQKGEKQYIMIPNPIKGDYRVEIIGTDNGKYDFTMIASEDMKLIEKQEKKNISITKDEVQTFTIIDLWESPKKIKEKAIDDLELIENDNEEIQGNIQNAIDLINESLDESLWIDESETHLDKELGIKVFNYELKAIERLRTLKKISKKLKINDPDLSSALENAENRLAKADYLLAEIVLDEAKNAEVNNDSLKKKIEKLIKKSEKELKKAKQDFEKDKPAKSINHSKRSWSYAQMAIRFANK